MGLLWRTLINAVAIAAAALIIPGIEWGVGYADDTSRYLSLAATGLVLGIVNAFVRPIFVMISLPITCVTLGLFLLVINALMLLLVSAIPILGFRIDGFLAALLGSIVISIVSAILSRVIPR